VSCAGGSDDDGTMLARDEVHGPADGVGTVAVLVAVLGRAPLDRWAHVGAAPGGNEGNGPVVVAVAALLPVLVRAPFNGWFPVRRSEELPAVDGRTSDVVVSRKGTAAYGVAGTEWAMKDEVVASGVAD
jgi:hypothetical protein